MHVYTSNRNSCSFLTCLDQSNSVDTDKKKLQDHWLKRFPKSVFVKYKEGRFGSISGVTIKGLGMSQIYSFVKTL